MKDDSYKGECGNVHQLATSEVVFLAADNGLLVGQFRFAIMCCKTDARRREIEQQASNSWFHLERDLVKQKSDKSIGLLVATLIDHLGNDTYMMNNVWGEEDTYNSEYVGDYGG